MTEAPPPSSPGNDEPPRSTRTSLVPPPPTPLATRERQRALGFLEHLGGVTQVLTNTGRALLRRPFEGRAIIEQIDTLGVASLGIVTVTSVFIGMVMAVQFAFGLRKFGGMEYTSRVVGLSFTRELAPTLTAVIVGGRISAGIAAEMGSMAVTEQIDAIRALGADPHKKLVLPRLIAGIVVMPVLSCFALVLGFAGAMVITDIEFGIPSAFFLRSALGTVTMADFVGGLFKTPFFGAIIALVGCYFGMVTRGGTAGVGNSTTRTVVVVSIAILIADFFLTKVSFMFWPSA